MVIEARVASTRLIEFSVVSGARPPLSRPSCDSSAGRRRVSAPGGETTSVPGYEILSATEWSRPIKVRLRGFFETETKKSLDIP